jgi:hypothetical protein
MSARDLRKRQETLTDLRARMAAVSAPAKPRQVMKKPQIFIMDVGELFTFPTSGGECINSYFRSKEGIPGGWVLDGCGAVVIAERGRAFDILTGRNPILSITEDQGETGLMPLLLWMTLGAQVVNHDDQIPGLIFAIFDPIRQ